MDDIERWQAIEDARETLERTGTKVEQPDPLAEVLSRKVERWQDKDRRELAEFYADLNAKREADAERKRKAVLDADRADIEFALNDISRVFGEHRAEIDQLQEDVAALKKTLAAAAKPAKLDADIGRLDEIVHRLEKSMREFSARHRRFDDLPLPLPAHLSN